MIAPQVELWAVYQRWVRAECRFRLAGEAERQGLAALLASYWPCPARLECGNATVADGQAAAWRAAGIGSMGVGDCRLMAPLWCFSTYRVLLHFAMQASTLPML